MKNDWKKNLWEDIYPFVIIGAVYLIFAVVGIGCPIRFMTGISCAGCGMTRAYLEFLHGHTAEAFACHPLFWLVPIAAALFLVRRSLPKNVRKSLIICIAGVFLLCYVWRMFSPDDSIVVWEPMNGFIYKEAAFLRKALFK